MEKPHNLLRSLPQIPYPIICYLNCPQITQTPIRKQNSELNFVNNIKLSE
jgi:hypothetical protein